MLAPSLFTKNSPLLNFLLFMVAPALITPHQTTESTPAISENSNDSTRKGALSRSSPSLNIPSKKAVVKNNH
jgi:hypothetical protein